jgi:TolB-like protein/tetratricopeptide (TPR) repeat protein
MGILAELRRRRLFRVAALYVVGAWMVLQVFDLLFPRLGVPDAVMDLAFIGALLGFPVALVFGWIYDITPQGITRTRPSRGDEDYSDLSLKRSDYLILSALLAVVAAIVYSLAIEVSEIPPEGDDLLAVQEAPENSIAVLPFTNMSSDPDNEFFCDGISEEILNKLSALGDLHVIARTSSFALKDSGYDIPKIAAILGVRYLLQGSVRRDGRQLRISTQLLDRSGQQLWNTTFERELESIFAIQRDIADSVAVTIAPQIMTTAESKHIPAIEAWEHYLLGHEMYVKRLPGFQWNAADQFRKAIELDPEFVEPYAELATVMILGARWDDDYQETFRRAQGVIDTALAIDPKLARAHAAEGLLLTMQRPPDFARAKVQLQKALDLDPNLVNAHNWLAGVLSGLGRDDEAIAQYELAARIDPLAPIINLNLTMMELDRGNTEAATQRMLRLLQVPRPSYHAYQGLEEIYRQTGRLVDYNKVNREKALAYARNSGQAWVPGLARSYVYLGMWQQAEYWYGFLENQYADVWKVQFDRQFLLRRQGRFEKIRERSNSILEFQEISATDLPPGFAMRYGAMLAMAGEFAGAIETLEQTLSFEAGGEASLSDTDAYDSFQAWAWAHMMTGGASRAEEILATLETVFLEQKSKGLLHTSEQRFLFAQNTLLAGDLETTLDRLQLAVDAGWRDYFLLLHDPRWVSMRDNSRFQEMMEAVKDDIDAQRVELELFDAEDDFLARIDAAIAEFEARSGDD